MHTKQQDNIELPELIAVTATTVICLHIVHLFPSSLLHGWIFRSNLSWYVWVLYKY